MADDLSFRVVIDGDSKPIIAALRKLDDQYGATRRALTASVTKIGSLESAQRGAEEAAKAVDEARRKVEFFRRAAEVGGSSGIKEYAKDIERAKKEAASAAAVLQRQQAIVSRLRGELSAAGIDTGRLADAQAKLAREIQRVDAAQARTRIKAGAVAAAGPSRVQAAADLIGVKDHAAIRSEIVRLETAYATLRASGTLTHTQLAQAASLTRAKIGALNEQMDGHRTTADRLAGAYGLLRTGLLVVQGLFAGNAVAKAVDEMRMLEARVKLVSASQESAGRAMRGIAAIAREAEAPIGQVGAAYVKYAGAIRALGGTQEQSLGLTRAIALGLRVSGASAQEAGAAMYQLGQAFQKGKLSGDEFVTLSESGGKLMDYLAAGLGKTKAELIDMAAAGELTADKMLEAWNKALPQIEKDAAAIPDTVGGAITNLGNAFSGFASESEALKTVLNGLAAGIQYVGEHLGAIAGIAIVAGIAALAANWAKLAVAIRAAAAAMGSFAVANPVMLALSLIAEIGVAVYDGIAGAAEEAEEAQRKAAEETAANRQDLEDQYANLVNRRVSLEKQAAESAKKLQKDVLDNQKKAINEQISDAERLRTELLRAYEDSGKLQNSYAEKAMDLRARIRSREYADPQTGQGKAQSDLTAGLLKLGQMAGDGSALEMLQRQAEAVRAIAGHIDDAVAARQALDKADKAEADALDRARAIEADTQRGLAEQIKLSEQSMADLQGQLTSIEESIAAITDEAKKLKVEADQEALEKVLSDIEAVKQKLAELPDQKTVALNVAATGSGPLPTGNPRVDAIPYATGGPVPGPGPVGVDSRLIMAAPGEHMLTAREVAAAGGHGAIYRLRQALLTGAIKGYAGGGPVGAVSQSIRVLAGVSATPAFPHLGRIDIGLGGSTHPVYAAPDVARQLRAFVSSEAMKRGRR